MCIPTQCYRRCQPCRQTKTLTLNIMPPRPSISAWKLRASIVWQVEAEELEGIWGERGPVGLRARGLLGETMLCSRYRYNFARRMSVLCSLASSSEPAECISVVFRSPWPDRKSTCVGCPRVPVGTRPLLVRPVFQTLGWKERSGAITK